jgi:hypothetical protein
MADTPNTATSEQNAPTAGLPSTEAGAPGASSITLQSPFTPSGLLPLPSAQGPQGQLSPEEQQLVEYNTRRLKAAPQTPSTPPPPPGFKPVVAQQAPPPPPGFKPVEAAVAPTEQKGPLGKIWDWANKGLISADAITKAMTGYSTEEIHNVLKADPGQPGPQVDLGPLGKYDLNTLATGTLQSSAGFESGMTSPTSIALFGVGPLAGAAGKSAAALRAVEAAKAADTAAETANTVHIARLGEVARATQQANELQEAARVAREAAIAGAGTEEAAIAAETTASQAIKNVTNAETAVKEAQESLALNRVAAAQANRTSLKAVEAARQAGILGKIPAPVGKVLTPISKGAMIGINAKMLPEAIEGQHEGETYDQMLERRLSALGWMAMSGEGLRGTPLDVPVEGVPKMVGGAAETIRNIPKNIGEAYEEWHAAREQSKVAREQRKVTAAETKADEIQNKAKKDFTDAVPSGPGKSNYTPDDLDVALPYLQHEHANVQDVKSIQDTYDALEHQRQGIENKIQPWVKKYANDPLKIVGADGKPATIKQRLIEALSEDEATTAGFTADALKAIEKYNTDNPSVGEGDRIRKSLNDANRGILKKNMWDVATARASDPAFAARYELADILRDGVYDQLEAKGVQGAREMRQDEASLIRVRNAAERQLKNGERTRKGTGEAGTVRQMLAKVVPGAMAAGGAGIGASTGIPLAPEALAAGGATYGKRIQERIAPSDLTVDKLLQRSMKALNVPGTPTELETGGALPAEITSPAHPRENSPLHADLATHYGEEIGETSYKDLEDRFLSDVKIKKQNRVPLDAPEKTLLTKINAAKVGEIKAAQKAAEEAAKAVAAAPKPKPVALPPEATHVVNPEAGKIEPVRPKGQAPSSFKEAGAQAQAPVTEPIQKTPQHILPEGYTDESLHSHEYGHAAAAAIEGIRATDFASHLHDSSVKEGLAGSVGWQEDPYIKDPDAETKYTRRELADNMMRWLRTYMGGAAANNALYDLPLDLSGDALHKDVVDARNLMKAYGIAGTDAEVLTRQAFKQTRNNFLTIPGVLDTISMNSGVREAGLRTDLHASEERMASFQNQIKELADEEQNAAINRRNDKTSRETLARNKGVVQGVGKERSGQGSRSAAIEGEIANGQSKSRVGQRPSGVFTKGVGEAHTRGERSNQGQGGGTNQGYARGGREDEVNPLNAETQAPFKTEPHQQFPEEWRDLFEAYGMSMPQVAYHELAHAEITHRNGFETGETLGQEHLEAKKVGGIARAEWNQSQFRNAETGDINKDAVFERLPDLLTQLYAGPVADELYFDIKMENNKGAAQDLKNIETMLDIAQIFDEGERAKYKDAAIDDVTKHLTRPGAHDIRLKYTQEREAGIPKELLMTAETSKKALAELDALGGQNEEGIRKVVGNNERTVSGFRGINEKGIARGEGEGIEGAARGAVQPIPAQVRTKAIESPLTQNLSYETMKGIKETFITDEDKNPLTFYRGESSGDLFDKFDPKKTGGLFFFATDPQHAKFYARAGTQPREFNLKGQNVLDLRNIDYKNTKTMQFLKDFASDFEGDVDRETGEPYDVISAIENGVLYDKEGSGSGRAWRSLFNMAKNVGYDAVLANDVTDGVHAPIGVVFDPEQIKFKTTVAHEKEVGVHPEENALAQNLSYEAMKGMKEARESENLPINVKKDVLENPLAQRLAELKSAPDQQKGLKAGLDILAGKK